MLKTLDRYIDEQPARGGRLSSLWFLVDRDRRFAVLLSVSIVLHLVFYATIIKLDSWAILRVIANKRQSSTVTMIEIAPPSDRPLLRAAPESLERADVNRLQFDPTSADDIHLIQRSPKPTEQRGNSGRLPNAEQIERQLRASRGASDRNRPGPASSHQQAPPDASAIQANRTPQFDEALIAKVPPTPAASVPPAPAAKQPSSVDPGSLEASAAGTRRGNASESSALGLEAIQAQYMAVVRAKIRITNERTMPREWIKDVLRDKVYAQFKLVIGRDGQILSVELWKPTGYSVLDDSARQAIFSASPFEGFPQAAGNAITLTVTVYFYTL